MYINVARIRYKITNIALSVCTH